MAGTSFYMFWFRFIPEMFSALSAAFLCSRAFRLFFCSFGCSLFCRFLGFREYGNGNECDGCVSVRYNFLFISLLLFTKVHKATTLNIGTSVLLIWENVNFTTANFKISSVEFWSYLTYSVWPSSPQAPQAQNTWCMRQLVYIENCMGKSPIVKKMRK